MLLPIFEDCTDCLLDIGERFLFGVALSHDLAQGRDKHGKSTASVKSMSAAEGLDVTEAHWSGRRESNPRMQLGKLPFYH